MPRTADTTPNFALTYNYGVPSYDIGTAFGHIAIAVPNTAAACDAVRAAGGNVTREAGPSKAAAPSSLSCKTRTGTRLS